MVIKIIFVILSFLLAVLYLVDACITKDKFQRIISIILTVDWIGLGVLNLLKLIN